MRLAMFSNTCSIMLLRLMGQIGCANFNLEIGGAGIIEDLFAVNREAALNIMRAIHEYCGVRS